MRLMLILVVALGLVSAAQATTPARTKLGMMPVVQASLLKIETRLSATTRLPVRCNVVPGTVPFAQCWVMRAGEQHPVVAVGARYLCGARGADPCSARPVCTYSVTVTRGFPVKVGFTGLLNVCRAGWEKTVK